MGASTKGWFWCIMSASMAFMLCMAVYHSTERNTAAAVILAGIVVALSLSCILLICCYHTPKPLELEESDFIEESVETNGGSKSDAPPPATKAALPQGGSTSSEGKLRRRVLHKLSCRDSARSKNRGS